MTISEGWDVDLHHNGLVQRLHLLQGQEWLDAVQAEADELLGNLLRHSKVNNRSRVSSRPGLNHSDE